MAKISRLIKKQKHYNYLREYGKHFIRGTMYDVRQFRLTPKGWMQRLWRIRGPSKYRGQWQFAGIYDPRPYYDNIRGWTKPSLCLVKQKFRTDGVYYIA